MAKISSFQDAINKNYGANTISPAKKLIFPHPMRIPSGIFSLDFASGGGCPLWGSVCCWGPEGADKTNTSINFLAASQRICWNCFNVLSRCTCSKKPLKMKGAVADAEGTLDIDWAERIGADPEKYLVVYGDHGQQVADIADSVLQADDCGLLVVDSLANLVPSAEMEESADAEFYAIQARLIGRMVRKLKQRLIRERKREHPCAIIFVNQMRMDLKAGKYQNPEKMSGGHALKHEFSLLFRSRAKALTEADKKYLDKTRAKSAIKRFAFSVRKSKVFTLSGLGEYLRVEEDIPDEDLSAGQINDYTTTINYAKEYGIIRKEKSKWRYFDFESIRTLSDIKNMLIKKPDEFLHLKIQIVKRAVARIKG